MGTELDSVKLGGTTGSNSSGNSTDHQSQPQDAQDAQHSMEGHLANSSKDSRNDDYLQHRKTTPVRRKLPFDSDLQKKTNPTKRSRKPSEVEGIQGNADSIELFRGLRENLNETLPWFQHYPMAAIGIKNITYPEELDWLDGKAVAEAFPPWTCTNGYALGTRQIPKCFLLDVKSNNTRLLLVNWWRGLTKEMQTDICKKDKLHRFYRAPMRSSSPFRESHDAPSYQPVARNTSLVANNAPSAPKPSSQKAATLSTNMSKLAPFSGFLTVLSCHDLAQRFRLSIDILYCARIETDTQCCVETCEYPAFQQNRKYCCLHKQNWWPRTGLEHYQKRRGHLLIGAEYAYKPQQQMTEAKSIQPVACGCSHPTCEGIGWSIDMAKITKGHVLPPEIVPHPQREKERPLRLAPWHYAPQHRVQLPDGTWQLTFDSKGSVGSDSRPIADYSPDDFLKEPSMVAYQARKSPFLLPPWVYEFRKCEQGPIPLVEYQRFHITKQHQELEQRYTTKLQEYHGLLTRHEQVLGKLEEMKTTHMRRKKRPKKKRRTTGNIGTVFPESASTLATLQGQRAHGRRQIAQVSDNPAMVREKIPPALFRSVLHNRRMSENDFSGSDEDKREEKGMEDHRRHHPSRRQHIDAVQHQLREDAEATLQEAQAIQFLQQNHQQQHPQLQQQPPQNSAFFAIPPTITDATAPGNVNRGWPGFSRFR